MQLATDLYKALIGQGLTHRQISIIWASLRATVRLCSRFNDLGNSLDDLHVILEKLGIEETERHQQDGSVGAPPFIKSFIG